MNEIGITAMAVALGICVIRMIFKNLIMMCSSAKRLDGKTCLVTGGTSGIGLEIAKDFARRGAKVVIGCPFQNEGQDALKLVKKESGNDNVVFKLLNLASLKSTREFAEDILKTEERLDVLVNNAGIGNEDKLTGDNLNLTMQINYYGHFLLTILLLPLLKKTGTPHAKSRIVCMSSILHMFGQYEVGKMNKVENRKSPQFYNNSKFCFILFARELTKRLRGSNVIINAANPGAVGTNIFRRDFGYLIGGLITHFFYFFQRTPREGAQTAVYLAIDDAVENISGEYFYNCKIKKAKKLAYDPESAKELFHESVKLVQLDDGSLKKAFCE